MSECCPTLFFIMSSQGRSVIVAHFGPFPYWFCFLRKLLSKEENKKTIQKQEHTSNFVLNRNKHNRMFCSDADLEFYLLEKHDSLVFNSRLLTFLKCTIR